VPVQEQGLSIGVPSKIGHHLQCGVECKGTHFGTLSVMLFYRT